MGALALDDLFSELRPFEGFRVQGLGCRFRFRV